jgi:hypothetical protein
MHPMILASLVLNIAVLLPVCLGLITRANWAVAAYGGMTPARGVLISIYLALLIASAVLLVMPVTTLIAGLLLMQVIYKLTTPFTVESFDNPVVVTNLVIAALHGVTLTAIWSEVGL